MSDYKTLQDIADIFQTELTLANSNLKKAKKSEALNFPGFIEPNETVFNFYKKAYDSYITSLFYKEIEDEKELLEEAITWLTESTRDLVKFNRFCSEAREAGDLLENKLQKLIKEVLQEEDRCKRIADRKYDKPSAYKSGAIVRCRKGNIWKNLKEDESLHKWFKRKGPSGKEGGWVDCNTCRKVNGKTKCKSCGRKKGEKRAKYPSCRPTSSQCKSPGKGKKWGKTK
jgi:hypothetical protein